MLHAQRPEGGTYSRHEVAEQFGNTPATLDRVYGRTLPDLDGVAGLTMDEIIRRAMRDVWGPMPGDPNYERIEYELTEAAALTRLTNKALAARISNGSLPGFKQDGKYLVNRFDLVWHGLLPRPDAS